MTPSPQRILVIMLRRIGDVILTTPAVRAIKKLFPQAKIDFLVEPPAHELLDGNPDLNEVLVYQPSGKSLLGDVKEILKIRARRYDWVIDYMGNPRSAAITALSGASLRAGPGHVFHRWAYSHRLIQSPTACYTSLEKIRVLKSLGLRPDEADFLPKLPSNLSPGGNGSGLPAHFPFESVKDAGPIVGFFPASRKITRQWPANSYAALGRMLRDHEEARIIVFWGPGERPVAEEISGQIGADAKPAPQTKSLKDLAALVRGCDLVVTNCNGPKHVAVALGIPTLTIHGSSDPVIWNPPDNARHQIIRLNDLFCIGCRKNECPYKLECMTQLSPDAVYARAKLMLNQSRSVAHGSR